MLFSLIKRDFTFTFKAILIKNILFQIVFLCISLFYIINLKGHYNVNYAKMVFENLKGILYYNQGDGFQLPMIWIIINFFIIFILANYMYDDLKNNGIYILTRIKKSKYFYYAKILWIIGNVFIYYLLIFLIMLIVSKVFLHGDCKYIFIVGIKVNCRVFIIKTFLLYVTTSLALVLFQNAISLFFNPVYSYLITIILIVLSVFISSKLMPGQHSLILRHAPFNKLHNLTFIKSLIYNFILSFFSVLIGYINFLKKDIL